MKLPKLTTAERVLKRNIEEIRSIVRINNQTLMQLKALCVERGHKIIPHDLDINEKLKTNEWASTGAYCYICSNSLGWWCPKSPDHLCHYPTAEECVFPSGRVISNIESCKYCGMPQERK